MKTLIFFCSLLFALDAQSQIDGFEYDFEQPFQAENSVQIHWTIISGSTCNGTIIQRSTDSIHFETIGTIEGVCGSANFNIPYDFTDNAPARNTRNYYRLEFGRVGFSETLSVFVVILDSDGVLVMPNPVKERTVIHFSNSRNKPFVFSLYDYSGKLARKEENLTDDKIIFDRNGLPQGVYLFQFSFEGEVKAKGKILIF